ncbi:hypothetical protein [Haliangium sp.]|uniref:hypothetical protein n=1 Tax=Haliangium sp. TaxID=2663208 RepID=UPI003D131632
MTSAPIDRPIYDLLPTHYRRRDAESGYLLRGVLETIEDELRLIEDDIDTLYENWFIETCEPWVVPYLGDLLGAEALATITDSRLRPRALVARVLEYRRMRGTVAGLEGTIRDVLDWTAHVVEYDDAVGGQRTIRRSPDQPQRQRLSGGLFHRPVDVERPYQGPGIPPLARDLGLFLWRTQRHTLRGAQMRPVAHGDQQGLYTVHPLGYDTPLFRQPRPRRPGEPPAPAHVPGRLGFDDHDPASESAYGDGRSVHVYLNSKPVPPEDIVFAPLSSWQQAADKVTIDPARGRVALPAGTSKNAVFIDATTAACGPVGGGGYPRAPFSTTLSDQEPWVYTIDRASTGKGSLVDALRAWQDSEQTTGVIRIADSHRYAAAAIRVSAGQRLVIEAADGVRPVIEASDGLTVLGEDGARPGQLVLDGLTVDATIEVRGPGALDLELHHCTTLAPAAPEQEPADELDPRDPAASLPAASPRPALVVADRPRHLAITLASCLSGPILAPDDNVTLSIRDSVVTCGGPGAPTHAHATIAADVDGLAPGPETTIERSTIFGQVYVRTMPRASDSVFVDVVRVRHRQVGVMRYCYVLPPAAPADAAAAGPQPALPARVACIPATPGADAPGPIFVSTRVGDPAFAQLAQACPAAIRTGAEDGGELGAWHAAGFARREDFLHTTILADYVPAGLDIDVFYVD